MRRLIQSKETTRRTKRPARQKTALTDAMAWAPPEIAAGTAEDTVIAAVKEEPLPIVMAEMALWGTAMSALMIPIGVVAMLASPFAIARDMWRSPETAAG